jgi:hypothetical protein
VTTLAQAPIRVTKGSVQYWPVKVMDAFNALTNLDTADLRFDLYKAEADDTETPIDLNSSADNNGMYALPLVDTTGAFEAGHYNLYITFVASPQTPRLGPFRFLVDG